MASPVDVPKGTNQIMKQGQTAGPFGNDPMGMAKGVAAEKPRDLKAS